MRSRQKDPLTASVHKDARDNKFWDDINNISEFDSHDVNNRLEHNNTLNLVSHIKDRDTIDHLD